MFLRFLCIVHKSSSESDEGTCLNVGGEFAVVVGVCVARNMLLPQLLFPHR